MDVNRYWSTLMDEYPTLGVSPSASDVKRGRERERERERERQRRQRSQRSQRSERSQRSQEKKDVERKTSQEKDLPKRKKLQRKSSQEKGGVTLSLPQTKILARPKKISIFPGIHRIFKLTPSPQHISHPIRNHSRQSAHNWDILDILGPSGGGYIGYILLYGFV